MNRYILLGIDASLSPPADEALQTVSALLTQSSPHLRVALLHVIPSPDMPSPTGRIKKLAPTMMQRTQAEQTLRRAHLALQEQGVAPERIELLLRHGTPADELVKIARELPAAFIVIGRQRDCFKQQLRRFLMGSTSQRVLRLAPCPVMLAIPPQLPHPRHLVAWYKHAITDYLHAHPDTLTVFTSKEVAHRFVPQGRTVGRKEVDAAARALEYLARDGVLCCHKVTGEVRYSND